MPRRDSKGRYVRSAHRARSAPPARPRSRTRRVYMRARSYGGRVHARVSGFFGKVRQLTAGAPNTAFGRPVSKMIAPTLGLAAEVNLVATPLAGSGDSAVGRVLDAVTAMQQGSDLKTAWIGTDGQNAASVFVAQVKQNAPDSIVLAIESLALGAFGRAIGG